MSTVIKVENLSKRYLLGHQQQDKYLTLRDSMAQAARNVGKRLLHPFRASSGQPMVGGDNVEEFWALKGVSFEIKQGDRVGIIGRNGAGKSTLLKILSRITEPTSGRVGIKGRVASLLEVGTGFHPELTGRENIFLNGAVLGMSKAEIKKKFDEIVAFAEVEKFLDTPVKRYSSGMYVRLAFAVAAHLEPEVLIVDEVLAVGDAQFQKKCLGKMEAVGREGRTVLFVSHNMEAVRKICNKGVLLNSGQVLLSGSAGEALQKYMMTGYAAKSEFHIRQPQNQDAPGKATCVFVEDCNGNQVNELPVGRPWQIRLEFSVNRKIDHFIVAIGFMTELNSPFRTVFSDPVDIEPGDYSAVFREDTVMMAAGMYPITVGLSTHERSFHYVENAGLLRIAEVGDGVELVRLGGVGLVLNPLHVEIKRRC